MSEITTHSKSADREPNEAKTSTVRGFFRRGAWKQRLDACGLPAETRALVASTVHATKLRPAEKLAVADELIAHFHDADRQGVETAAARAAFGEPAVAAKLIRRAKKRNRGWFSKLKTCVSWGIGAFVVFYAVLAIRFYSGEPEVKVDYLARISATAEAVPESDQAWPEIHRALEAMGFSNDAVPQAWNYAPDETGQPTPWAFLAENASKIEQIREATRRPRLGFTSDWPAGDSPSALERETNVWIRPLGPLGTAASALAFDALAAAAQNDATRATESLCAMIRLSNLSMEGQTLRHVRFSASVRDQALRILASILDEHSEVLRSSHLLALESAFSSKPPSSIEALRSEALFFEDMLQRIYTDDGNGNGRLTPVGIARYGEYTKMPQNHPVSAGTGDSALRLLQRIAAPASLVTRPNRASISAAHESLLLAAQLDLLADNPTPGTPALDEFEAGLAPMPECSASFHIVFTTIGPIRSTIQSLARLKAKTNATLVALAIHRHRLLAGSFPNPSESYAQLVPTYLKEAPCDPMTREPLRWTIRDGQPLIYSLGADGDDDGGVAPTDDLGGNDAAFAPPEEAVNGDWIAWPPQ